MAKIINHEYNVVSTDGSNRICGNYNFNRKLSDSEVLKFYMLEKGLKYVNDVRKYVKVEFVGTQEIHC